MVHVSCRAAIELSKQLDVDTTDEALRVVKDRMRAAALQAALDLRRDGYVVVLDVFYLVAYGGND